MFLKHINMKLFFVTMVVSMSLVCCAQKKKTIQTAKMTEHIDNSKTKTATFGTGCFWCTEAIFQQVEGVIKVTSGYSGGRVENPSYKLVCTGTTGHAECLNIEYDPAKVTFDELLEMF